MGGPKLTDADLFTLHEAVEWCWRQDLPARQRKRYLNVMVWIEEKLKARGYTLEYSRLHAADSEKEPDP